MLEPLTIPERKPDRDAMILSKSTLGNGGVLLAVKIWCGDLCSDAEFFAQSQLERRSENLRRERIWRGWPTSLNQKPKSTFLTSTGERLKFLEEALRLRH